MIDINAIGIGAIIGATFVAGTNLFVAWRNRIREDIKERLEKLYLPMHKVLCSPKAMDNQYETFLEVENLYTEYEHLVSPKLEQVLYDVVSQYHSLLIEGLADVEVKERMIKGNFKTYKRDVIRDFHAIIYDIDGVVDAGKSELLRQYRGGFRVYFLNFIQFFHSSPYSPKEWRKDFAGYKDDN